MKGKTSLLLLILAALILAAVILPLIRGGGTAETPPSPSQALTLVTATPAAAATPAPTAAPTPDPTPEPAPFPTATPESNLPTEGEYYYDLENVILYLELYDALPGNYITKKEARDLGWSGGPVEKYKDGAAIGGDRFGNREGQLPAANGRSYTECDLNTLGQKQRGAERLCFSNDGLYFYTGDHYEHFTEYVVTQDWEVVPK